MRSKTRRSPLKVFWTPALRRLSRMMATKSAASRAGGASPAGPSAPFPSVARQHPMRREALDRERPGHADARVVLVGLVVEQLGVGVTADGGVDLLARHALADVGVVGDRLQRDVRDALVDEALANVARVGRGRRRDAGQLGLALRALRRVRERVVREARAHEASARERERDATRVDGDPASTPLLGHDGRRPAAAGGVEDQVAWVGGHEQAALDDFDVRLHNVDLRLS